MNKTLCVFTSLLLVIHSTVYAAQSERAGQVIFTQGDVKVLRANESVELQRRSAIYSHDEIHVGPASRVQLRMIDGAIFSVDEDSVFRIAQYHFNRKTAEDSVILKFIKGSLRTITGSIGKADRKAYRMETPLATIGIRGTDYELLMNSRGLEVFVWEGAIQLSTTGSGSGGCNSTLGNGTANRFAFISFDGNCNLMRQKEDKDRIGRVGKTSVQSSVSDYPDNLTNPVVYGTRESDLSGETNENVNDVNLTDDNSSNY